jgi:hypothetical protein
MKKITFILVFILSIVYADLPGYVSKFDTDFAIELLNDKINLSRIGSNNLNDVLFLAELYNKNEQVDSSTFIYKSLFHYDLEKYEKYYFNHLYKTSQYKLLRNNICYFNKNELTESLTIKSFFHEGKFDSSKYYYDRIEFYKDQQLLQLINQGNNLKYKSPFIGGALSAIIPGSGKMYAQRYRDGFQAFTMISIMGVNAYHSYRVNGFKDFRTIIFSSIAIWYYLSDIYGSVQAINTFNYSLKDEVINQYDE